MYDLTGYCLPVCTRGLLTMHLWYGLSTSASCLNSISHSPIVLTTRPPTCTWDNWCDQKLMIDLEWPHQCCISKNACNIITSSTGQLAINIIVFSAWQFCSSYHCIIQAYTLLMIRQNLIIVTDLDRTISNLFCAKFPPCSSYTALFAPQSIALKHNINTTY